MCRMTPVEQQQLTAHAEYPADHSSHEPYAPDPMKIFLKLKPNFLIITQDEIEGKLLRIIEAYTERAIAKCHAQPDDCLWVSIAQDCFMDALLGTVQSKTTLASALAHLQSTSLIFERPGQNSHKPNAYLLNKPLIALLCSMIPKNMKNINMQAIMRKPRKVRNKRGQLMTPPPVDPLVQTLRDTMNDPQNRQLLTPPSTIIDETVELNGGHSLTPKRRYNKDNEKEKKEAATCPTPTTYNDPQPPPNAAATHHIVTIDFDHVTRDVLLDLQQCLHRLLAKTDVQANEQSLTCFAPIPEEITEVSFDLQAQDLSSQEDKLEQKEPAYDGAPALRRCSAPAVVKLVEGLRGRPYTASERPRELRSAIALLNLTEAPQLSLEEIREAWEHGSDDWWRSRYGDDVHVHDLVLKDSQGKRRVLAFLEHKRRSARFATASDRVETPYVPMQDTLATLPEAPETYEFLACEADAAALAAQIEREVRAQGYDIMARVEEDEYHPGIWYVQAEWWADADASKTHRVSSYAAWKRYFAQQHAIMQYHTVPA